MKPNTKEFKNLQRKWYDKLDKKEFKDIEYKGHLKRSERFYALERYSNETAAVKEEYYRLAGHFLYDFSFETALERAIWELHSTGLSVRKIVTALKKRRFHVYRRKVDEIVRKLAAEMIKYARQDTSSNS